MKFKASSNIFDEIKRANPINAHVISSKVDFIYMCSYFVTRRASSGYLEMFLSLKS